MDPNSVCDRNTFIEFVRRLRAELQDPASKSEWENTDLACFLEAMEAWTTDLPPSPQDNPWQFAATLLTAGKGYE